jgi:hypothetical protein
MERGITALGPISRVSAFWGADLGIEEHGLSALPSDAREMIPPTIDPAAFPLLPLISLVSAEILEHIPLDKAIVDD